MNDEELELHRVEDGLMLFRSVDPFVVDGVVYTRFTASNVVRQIFDLKIDECACIRMADTLPPGRCGFDYSANMSNLEEGECHGDSYRWAPGMVYYRPVPTEPYRKADREQRERPEEAAR
jgi:hypothetical protein